MYIDCWQPLSVPQTADHLYFLCEGGKYFIQFSWLKFRVQAVEDMGKWGVGNESHETSVRHELHFRCCCLFAFACSTSTSTSAAVAPPSFFCHKLVIILILAAYKPR